MPKQSNKSSLVFSTETQSDTEFPLPHSYYLVIREWHLVAL